MRILVVEDEKILCDTIVRSLSRLAYMDKVDGLDAGATPWSTGCFSTSRKTPSGTIVQMAPLPFPSARMKSSFKFAWQIRASEFRSSTGKASFSHSSAWTSPGAGNTAVSDWDFLWSGKSRHFTAAR